MTEAQVQLQNALTTTFLANLVFLSEYDNDLFQRVDELSKMIESGSYVEKYYLEFVMEDGDFDIYDVVNHKYLYNRKPKSINSNLVSRVNFNIKDSIFELAPHFIERNHMDFDYDKRFDMQNILSFNHLTICHAQEYTNITKDYIDHIDKKKFKKINKFIFIGTLLGRHIPKIAEKIDADLYLVLEKNLEIFRLSLFTVDYTILAKKGVIFSIMDDIIEEENKINNFLTLKLVDNYLLKISTTNINIEEYVDKILSLIKTLNPIAFDYNRHLYTSVNRTTKKLLEKYKFLNISEINKYSTFFNEKPILYVAAGPSLDEHIQWIKVNQSKFFIVCIGRVVKKLVDNNINIDVIITLDEQSFLANSQFPDNIVDKLNERTLLFASAITNNNILNKFNKENIFLFETYDSLFIENKAFDGFSVGEIGLDILLQFNPKEVYLIGLDFSLNQETGSSHALDDRAKKLNLNDVQDRSKFEFKNSIINVEGNFQDKVYTTPLFYSSINHLNNVLKSKKEEINLYNTSNTGAKFINTIAIKVNDIDIAYFDKLEYEIEEFISFLDLYSYKKLDNVSKIKLEEEINFLNIDVNKNINELLLMENVSFDKFFESFELFLLFLDKNKLASLSKILYLHYRVHMPYLRYYFNDKNIKAEKSKVKKLKTIFINQVKNIINDYKICLERLI